MSSQEVYYPYMPSIVGKKHGNQTYYYLVTSARVDGKPRIVEQEYLGTSEEVLARLTAGDQSGGGEPGMPQRVQHKGFGDLSAVWSTLTRLGVADAIDEAVGARRSDAAASVGTYLALAIANRVVAPCSKLGFADWWATTAGPRFTKIGTAACGHRNFWSAMDLLDAEALIAAERAIAARMVSQFDLDLSGLALDMDQLRDVHRLGQRQGPDRATRARQTETQRPATGRSRAGRHPRRRDPDPGPRLPRQPTRRDPVRDHHR